MESEWSTLRPGRLAPRERTAVQVQQQVGWAPEPVWTLWGRERYLAYAGMQPTERPARIPVTTVICFLGSVSDIGPGEKPTVQFNTKNKTVDLFKEKKIMH
jgi:hypothetical protein